MPRARVSEDASDLLTSLKSLERLARAYEVSPHAMLLRLRQLGFWQCELSVWYRMTNEGFVLDRKLGGRKANWRWVDERILERAWQDAGTTPISGRTFVDFEGNYGREFARRVHYEIRRRGDFLIALWSPRKMTSRRRLPLLRSVGSLPPLIRGKSRMS